MYIRKRKYQYQKIQIGMNFTEDLQVANKHMKLCSALLMGGIQIRTTVRFHFIPT